MEENKINNRNYNYDGLVKSTISSKELGRMYELMEDCDKPYSCQIKVDPLGHRWIFIHCSRNNETFFRKMLRKAMEI